MSSFSSNGVYTPHQPLVVVGETCGREKERVTRRRAALESRAGGGFGKEAVAETASDLVTCQNTQVMLALFDGTLQERGGIWEGLP